MVNKKLLHLVSGFTPVNEGISTIRIKAKFYNINLICAHAPMEEKDNGVKDAFYAKIKDIYDKCQAHEAKIVHGEFNANIGREGTFGPTGGPLPPMV